MINFFQNIARMASAVMLNTLLLCLPLAALHEVAMATYELRTSEGTVLVEAQFDQPDLDYVLKEKGVQEASFDALSAYIGDHISIAAEGLEVPMIVCEIEQEGHHYIVFGEFPIDLRPAESFSLINDCMVDEIPDHSNVYYLHDKGEVRGFRLHSERRRTMVKRSKQ